MLARRGEVDGRSSGERRVVNSIEYLWMYGALGRGTGGEAVSAMIVIIDMREMVYGQRAGRAERRQPTRTKTKADADQTAHIDPQGAQRENERTGRRRK